MVRPWCPFIQNHMFLNNARPQSHSAKTRIQIRCVVGMPNNCIRKMLFHLKNKFKVNIFILWRILGNTVRKCKGNARLFQHIISSPNLFNCTHTGRYNHWLSQSCNPYQSWNICHLAGSNLKGIDSHCIQFIRRFQAKWRTKILNTNLFAVFHQLSVLLQCKCMLLQKLIQRNIIFPRNYGIRKHFFIRQMMLKLNAVCSGKFRLTAHFLCHFHITHMIITALGNNINRVAVSYFLFSNLQFTHKASSFLYLLTIQTSSVST